LNPYLKILRSKKAKEKTGLGDTHFDDIQNPRSKYYDPTFPKAVRVGTRATGHFEHELDMWLQNRPRVNRQKSRNGCLLEIKTVFDATTFVIVQACENGRQNTVSLTSEQTIALSDKLGEALKFWGS
jgi:prophage regulatory protein